jgi:aminoglycoside 6-adenylyltransferase
MELIRQTGEADDRILGAYLEGSRANQNAPKDIFQDYDVVYVVRETGSFISEHTWIDRFGERLYMQYPEDGENDPHDRENCYGWLMQFCDGVRIDLHVVTQSYATNTLGSGEPYRVLLDKVYWIKRPDETAFHASCNEFWWCLNNIAKGLWRDEPPYVMDMLNCIVRPELIRMLGWRVGFETNFMVSVGKSGKYLYRWLPKQTWERLLETYPQAEKNEIWRSVFVMCDLFDQTAAYVAEELRFCYDQIEAKNSRDFCAHVHNLSKNADSVY